jgi:hypothetical protein
MTPAAAESCDGQEVSNGRRKEGEKKQTYDRDRHVLPLGVTLELDEDDVHTNDDEVHCGRGRTVSPEDGLKKGQGGRTDDGEGEGVDFLAAKELGAEEEEEDGHRC